MSGLPPGTDCDGVVAFGDYIIPRPQYAWAPGLGTIGLQVTQHQVIPDAIVQRGGEIGSGVTWERIFRAGWWGAWSQGIGTAVIPPVGPTPIPPGPVGANLFTNPGFATDTAWTKGATWTISGGRARCNGTTNTFLYQAVTLTAGSVYRVAATIGPWTTGISAAYFMSSPTATLGTSLWAKSGAGTVTGAGVCPVGATGVGFWGIPQSGQSSIAFEIDDVALQLMTLSEADQLAHARALASIGSKLA